MRSPSHLLKVTMMSTMKLAHLINIHSHLETAQFTKGNQSARSCYFKLLWKLLKSIHISYFQHFFASPLFSSVKICIRNISILLKKNEYSSHLFPIKALKYTPRLLFRQMRGTDM